MAQPIDTLCMGCSSAACDFKPLKMKRRPLGPGDVLIEMKYCGACARLFGLAEDPWLARATRATSAVAPSGLFADVRPRPRRHLPFRR